MNNIKIEKKIFNKINNFINTNDKENVIKADKAQLNFEAENEKYNLVDVWLINYFTIQNSSDFLDEKEINYLLEHQDIKIKTIYHLLQSNNHLKIFKNDYWQKIFKKKPELIYTVFYGGKNLNLSTKAIDILIDNAIYQYKDNNAVVAAFWQADKNNIYLDKNQIWNLLTSPKSDLNIVYQTMTPLMAGFYYINSGNYHLDTKDINYLIDNCDVKYWNDRHKNALHWALKHFEKLLINSDPEQWINKLIAKTEYMSDNNLFKILTSNDYLTNYAYNKLIESISEETWNLLIKNCSLVRHVKEPILEHKDASYLMVEAGIKLSDETWSFLFKHNFYEKKDKKKFLEFLKDNRKDKLYYFLLDEYKKNYNVKQMLKDNLPTFYKLLKIMINKPESKKETIKEDNSDLSLAQKIETMDLPKELKDQAQKLVKQCFDYQYEKIENKILFVKFYPNKILHLLEDYLVLKDSEHQQKINQEIKESFLIIENELIEAIKENKTNMQKVALKNFMINKEIINRVAEINNDPIKKAGLTTSKNNKP